MEEESRKQMIRDPQGTRGIGGGNILRLLFRSFIPRYKEEEEEEE